MKRRSPPGVLALLLLLSTCTTEPAPETTEGFEKPISFSILDDYDKGDDLREVRPIFRSSDDGTIAS